MVEGTLEWQENSSRWERAAVQGMREQGKSVLVGHCFVVCQVELALLKGISYSCLYLVLLKNKSC